jgi:PKHD-type hydroxylase
MIQLFKTFIPPALVAEIVNAFAQIAFRDGKASAGAQAQLVKDNLQAVPGDPVADRIKGALADAIMRHPEFRLAMRPKRLSPILLSRYEAGMEYGAHVDHPLSGEDMRRDVSFTLFLSAPETYDGGALTIIDGGGERAFRPAAGTLLAYPATSLHRVSEVTRGARLAAVGWAQSMIRDAAKRELLYDLNVARLNLFDRHGKTEDSDRLAKSAANLFRMWADL